MPERIDDTPTTICEHHSCHPVLKWPYLKVPQRNLNYSRSIDIAPTPRRFYRAKLSTVLSDFIIMTGNNLHVIVIYNPVFISFTNQFIIPFLKIIDTVWNLIIVDLAAGVPLFIDKAPFAILLYNSPCFSEIPDITINIIIFYGNNNLARSINISPLSVFRNVTHSIAEIFG